MTEFNKITNPIFLLSVILLIANDWIFKTTFHNELTGKLSDFAGLFAFPFLLSLIFPKSRKTVHLLTGILFLLWNSTFSQPFVDFSNGVGLPINRTIDVTDNIALLSIFLSYRSLNYPVTYHIKPILQKAIIGVSCIAFMATSIPPREDRKYVNINKEYAFEFSKRELVSRLNMVQIERVNKLNKASGAVDFDSESNVFYYQGHSDTLALILDYNDIQDQDTIVFQTSFAEIAITGNQEISHLKLLSVYKYIPSYSDNDYREKAIKQFEKRIIKKVKKYR